MIREPLGAGEKVVTVLRKEGEMVKPTDTRCQAVDENSEDGRCPEPISFNEETGTWLVWCKGHESVERQARTDGGERVQRVERVD